MRIRSLKPEFFKNELLCELSPWHRLCFEGLWSCADRDGRMQDRPKRLKADIFPYDDLSMDLLLWDLSRAGFIKRYLVDGQPLIWIPTWTKHQHPRLDEAPSALSPYVDGSDRPAVTIHPTDFPSTHPVQIIDPSLVRATVTDPSLESDDSTSPARMGSGVLGLGSGVLDLGSGRSGAESPRDHFRAADLVELWNAVTHPPIVRCREVTDDRRRKIRARLAKRPLLTEWRTVFERIQASAFCRGETDRGGWVADLDWITRNDTIAVKVLEGKYDDRAGPIAAVGTGSKRIAGLMAGGEKFLKQS